LEAALLFLTLTGGLQTMYTVCLLKGRRVHECKCRTEDEARGLAHLYWFLDPVIKDPFGNILLDDVNCVDSEY